ncbi:hypothetical protein QN364_19010 [Undibacterium sp. CCC1.1]|nr:hypothetical protein [Undibacterium sp. CCC1.1]
MDQFKIMLKKTEIENISIAEAGERPFYNSLNCWALIENQGVDSGDNKSDQSYAFGEPQWDKSINLKESDTAVVNQLLLDSNNRDAYQLFRLMPHSVMWWIRINKGISLITLTTAIHETVHDMHTLMRKCNSGNSTYLFNGYGRITERHPGDSANFSIVEEVIPDKFKVLLPSNSNFNTYIIKSKKFTGNDISTGVDEFNAYTIAANLETNLTSTSVYQKFKTSGLDSYSGNISGMSDFMLYILCYFKAARAHYPSTYQNIQNSHLFLAHINRLWESAENTLSIAYKFTLSEGGIYYVNSQVIAEIYSPELISELDLLGVKHLHFDHWNNTYFSKNRGIKNLPEK